MSFGEIIAGGILGQSLAELSPWLHNKIGRKKLKKLLEEYLQNVKYEKEQNNSAFLKYRFDFGEFSEIILDSLFDKSIEEKIFSSDSRIRNQEIERITADCSKACGADSISTGTVKELVENCFCAIGALYLKDTNPSLRVALQDLSNSVNNNSNKNTGELKELLNQHTQMLLDEIKHSNITTSAASTFTSPANNSTYATTKHRTFIDRDSFIQATSANRFLDSYFSDLSVNDRLSALNTLNEMGEKLASIKNFDVRKAFAMLIDYSKEETLVDVGVFFKKTGASKDPDIWRTLESEGLIDSYLPGEYVDYECWKIRPFSDGYNYWDTIKEYCNSNNIDFFEICCNLDFSLLD